MASIVLLFACLLIGVVLRRTGRLPENAHAALNGFVFNISLPALVLVYLHGLDLAREHLLAVAMPWVLFTIGCGFFWLLGRACRFDKPTVGALMLAGGLANTSFVGLPMIEAFYGPQGIPTGILIDQLGTYLVLSTMGLGVAATYSGEALSKRAVLLRVATFPPLIALVLALALWGVAFPPWLNESLRRLSATLVPLALVSVGLQLRLDAVTGNLRALLAGLSFKLVLGPAAVAALYLLLTHAGGQTMRVTLFESAMGPMIGGAIVASQHGLNPPLVSLMVGAGIALSFVTLPVWYLALQFM
jgi:predicted permease